MLPSEFIRRSVSRKCSQADRDALQRIADEINSRLNMDICYVDEPWFNIGYIGLGIYLKPEMLSSHGEARAELARMDKEVQNAA